jgi:DNA-binding transcriptional regulator GbsR (MarR family)
VSLASFISVLTEITEVNKMKRCTRKLMDTSLTNLPELSLTPAMQAFIENIALYYETYGIPRIAGRMFGLSLVTTTPLSAEQIARLLDASLSSVSTNVRALIANGWVEKATFPGDRTTYYRFSPSAWENVMERRKQGIAPLKAMAEQMKLNLPAGDPAYQQLNGMSQWADLLMHHYEQLIAAWKAHKAAEDNQKEG